MRDELQVYEYIMFHLHFVPLVEFIRRIIKDKLLYSL